MRQQVILDTGAIVALINRQDQHHQWVVRELATIQPPLITCEAVISEAFFLLRRVRNGIDSLKKLLDEKHIQVVFQLDPEVQFVTALIIGYSSVPMAFADACLVRMTELYPNSAVFTIDHDFQIYRKNTHQLISTIAPWNLLKTSLIEMIKKIFSSGKQCEN